MANDKPPSTKSFNTRPLTLSDVRSLAKANDITSGYNVLAEAAKRTNSLADLGKAASEKLNRLTGTSYTIREAAKGAYSLADLGRATSENLNRLTGAGSALNEAPKRAPSPSIRSSADIGYLVKEARERMHLSQQRFADLAGVGRRFVSELENGKTTLELGKVLQVCNAAGIDIHAESRVKNDR